MSIRRSIVGFWKRDGGAFPADGEQTRTDEAGQVLRTRTHHRPETSTRRRDRAKVHPSCRQEGGTDDWDRTRRNAVREDGLTHKIVQCSFVEHLQYKVVYRRYASLFFMVGVDQEEVRETKTKNKRLHGSRRKERKQATSEEADRTRPWSRATSLCGEERTGSPRVHPLPGGNHGQVLRERVRAGHHAQPRKSTFHPRRNACQRVHRRDEQSKHTSTPCAARQRDVVSLAGIKQQKHETSVQVTSFRVRSKVSENGSSSARYPCHNSQGSCSSRSGQHCSNQPGTSHPQGIL